MCQGALYLHTDVIRAAQQDGAPSGMSGLPAAGAKSGGYVPPSIRNRAPGDTGDSMNKRREENSVRVTNLSEDTREDDLRVSCLSARRCCQSRIWAKQVSSWHNQFWVKDCDVGM